MASNSSNNNDDWIIKLIIGIIVTIFTVLVIGYFVRKKKNTWEILNYNEVDKYNNENNLIYEVTLRKGIEEKIINVSSKSKLGMKIKEKGNGSKIFIK